MEINPSMLRIAKSIAPLIKQSSNLQDSIPQTLRTNCVSVRLNNSELQLLNTKRGSTSKGEWLRMASLDKLPTIIPPVNIDTWKTLGEINQKLNRIALHIDNKSKDSKLTNTELFVVRRKIAELRQHLLNADIWSKPDEGHAEDQAR
jgi:polyphosphate kinase